MRVVLQRVSEAAVEVEHIVVGRIDRGLLILVSVEDADGPEDIEWLTQKIVNLRIFEDAEGVMNRSLLDVRGELLLVSQFTLHASTRKGTRPSWHRASKPEIAIPRYEAFRDALSSALGHPVATGIFGAHMRVQSTNHGPVTLIMDSKARD